MRGKEVFGKGGRFSVQRGILCGVMRKDPWPNLKMPTVGAAMTDAASVYN